MFGIMIGPHARRLVAIVALAAIVLLQTGCGTLIHPERRGQTGGRIDPAIAILNGVGLLLFIIPGLIAYAIDFSTGAIYLPPEETDSDDEVVVDLDPEDMTPEAIAEALTEHAGVTVTAADVRRAHRADAFSPGPSVE